MVERRGAYKVLTGKPEGKGHLENLLLDVRIILKRVFKLYVGGMETVDLSCDMDKQ